MFVKYEVAEEQNMKNYYQRLDFTFRTVLGLWRTQCRYERAFQLLVVQEV